MLSGEGIRLFHYRGIQVSLDYSWFIIFFLVLVMLGGYYFPEQFPGVSTYLYWVYAFLAALLFFTSILLHEFGHAITAKNRGVGIDRIVLFIFGGIARMTQEPDNARDEFAIAAAGPLVSLLLGLGFLGFAVAVDSMVDPALHGLLWYIGYINVILVVFNMVPGFPLDGGRILRAVIWHYTGNLRKATGVVSGIGQGFAFLLMFGGVMFLFAGGLVTGVFWIFIGIFLLQSAKSGYQMVALREGLSDVKVEQLMSPDPIVVTPDLTLDILVDDYFFKNRYSSFPVVEGDRLAGMVELNQVKMVDRGQWPYTTVRDIMTPEDQVKTITPRTDAFDVLMNMIDEDPGRLPVVENGRIMGVISHKDILQFVELRENLHVR